jgi:hypothetical protein
MGVLKKILAERSAWLRVTGVSGINEYEGRRYLSNLPGIDAVRISFFLISIAIPDITGGRFRSPWELHWKAIFDVPASSFL